MVGTDDDFGILDGRIDNKAMEGTVEGTTVGLKVGIGDRAVFAVGCREEAPVLTGFMLRNGDGDGDEVLRVGIRVGFRDGVLVGRLRRTPPKP